MGGLVYTTVWIYIRYNHIRKYIRSQFIKNLCPILTKANVNCSTHNFLPVPFRPVIRPIFGLMPGACLPDSNGTSRINGIGNGMHNGNAKRQHSVPNNQALPIDTVIKTQIINGEYAHSGFFYLICFLRLASHCGQKSTLQRSIVYRL